MKRRTAVIVAAVVVVAVVAATLVVLPTLTTPAEPVKIGYLTPLSPPGDASAGMRLKRGAEIAVEMFNEQGGVLGRKIELIVEDDAGTPEKGVAGARKLITADKVVAVGGQYHSSVALQVQEVCEEYKVVCMFPHPSAAAISEKGRMWTFRIHVTDLDRTDVLVRWAKEKGFKRVAAVAENTDFGLGYIRNLKAKMAQYQYSPTFFEIVFDRTTKDLTPELLKVKEFNPDLIINIGVGAPTFLMINQAHEVGLLPRVQMAAAFDWPTRVEYWDNVGEKGVGIAWVGTFHPKIAVTDMGQKFLQKYRQKYNEDPVYADFQGFGNIYVLVQAIQKAGSTDPERIRQALLAHEFDYWVGKVKFRQVSGPDWQHVSVPSLHMAQWTATRQKLADAPILFPRGLAG
ncbi:MAG: ABC transporter substrate-binding protein [Candidatus Caldarchaeum sp.]|nr:ABC transporter substrate-binding protein [Candidatus Caldarchaeum sp.]MDW8063736.1 ABC transporter substrate-binding protein [Candidatus Caldarchaeum sp.]MDW8435969.1 ABC transporter substrate-binding protein [Candidatus Caldarchaeum sp.]